MSGKYKRGKSSSRLIWSLIALLKYQTIDKCLHLRKGKYHLDSNLLDRVITLYKITKEQPLKLFKNLLQRDSNILEETVILCDVQYGAPNEIAHNMIKSNDLFLLLDKCYLLHV